MSETSDTQDQLRIDMSKPQVLSAGAASYMKMSEAELKALRDRAEDAMRSVEALKEDARVFGPDGTCVACDLLPAEVARLLKVDAGALVGMPYDELFHKVRHVFRMCRKALEIVEVRKDKAYNQSVSRILYGAPGGSRPMTLQELFGGRGLRAKKR